jgi:hypothetical protein
MNKNTLSVVVGVVLGALVCYTGYQHIDKMAEKVNQKVLGKHKEMIDNAIKEEYPIGTFEYEVKRTI